MKHSRLKGQRGQTLVEASLVMTILILLMLGILEFGRAFVVVSTINNAARVGARAVALAPPLERDLDGMLISSSSITTQVRSEIGSIVSASVANALNINVTQQGNPPLAQVTISGSVPYMFNLVGTEFEVNRTVSFRDEGREVN